MVSLAHRRRPHARALPLLALLLALACPLEAVAQKSKAKSKSKDTARAAATRLEQALAGDQAPELETAIEGLARFDDPLSVEALLSVFEKAEDGLFPAARRVLGGYSQPASAERLLAKGVVHRSPRVRSQLALMLGEARPAAVDWAAVLNQLLDDESPLVRAAAVRELGRARIDTRIERIIELATDPSERVRAEVPGALTRLGGPRALPQLQALLKDPRWRVRYETIGALADLRTPEIVKALVDSLETERGRLQEDVVAQLERLTGKPFGFDLASWKDFVLQAPPDFLSQPPTQQPVRVGTPKFGTGGVRYHTIGTASLRFVLVTDLSGSMETPIKLPGRSEAQPRLALAKSELAKLIEGLDPIIAFDLITFRDTVEVWKPQMVLAGDSQRRAALSEVARYTASGGTNIFGALEAVFDIAERAMDDESSALQDVDTLFLLSDGAPSDGLIRDTDLLLEHVAERNRTLRLRIHCISLVSAEEVEAERFLKSLAQLGGGEYTGVATVDSK